MKYNLKKISGDASFREFYRLKKNNKTSIIVSAKKEKFKNLAVYAVINNVLNNNMINAPKLLSNHYKNDMIEIWSFKIPISPSYAGTTTSVTSSFNKKDFSGFTISNEYSSLIMQQLLLLNPLLFE